MIIYGSNNFKIKSYSHKDFQLPSGEGWEDVSFEVRQKYAHLFWIPFFPIGKIYAMKKRGSKDLYEMPIEIRNFIKQRHSSEIKTPFYAWSLFILAIGAVLFFIGNNMYRDRVSAQNREYRNNERQMMFDFPTTGDYYEVGYHDKNSLGTIAYFKVKSYTDNDITLISHALDLNLNEYLNRDEVYKKFDLTEYLNQNEVVISKEDLKLSFLDKSKISTKVGLLSINNIYRRPLK